VADLNKVMNNFLVGLSIVFVSGRDNPLFEWISEQIPKRRDHRSMMMNVWVQGSATMDKAPKVKNWLQSVGLSLTVSHSKAPWFGGIQSPDFGRMIEKLTSPGPKHRICEKRIGVFKHSGGHDQGVGNCKSLLKFSATR
jgi:hypothetical protein